MEGPLVPISEEKHEPASDIDTVAVDSLKALDPEWPIREEADMRQALRAHTPERCAGVRAQRGVAPAHTKGSTSSTSRRSCAIASPMVEIRKVMRRQPHAA